MTSIIPKANTIIAYTDGACKGNPGAGGWGAYLIFPDGNTQELYAGEANTTNNRMEMMATIQAICYASQHRPNDALELWTDSSYVKNGITQWIDGWKKKGWKTAGKKPVKNKDLWQQLDALNQANVIHWNWIKGHAGHPGNEKADELANQGVINPIGNIQEPQSTKITEQTLKKNLTKHSAINPDDDWMTTDILGFDDDILIEENDAEFNTDLSADQFKHSSLHNKPINMTDYLHNSQTESNVFEEIPEFDGDTSRANPNFRALLPSPINQGLSNRQLIMDTETTGFEFNNGDRIIEVGIVEMVGRKFTGEKLHVYINPDRQTPMDEEVIRVHGITDEFLADKPTFDKVAKKIYDFMIGAEVIAHNATFDMNFLNMEFAKVGLQDFASKVTVTDSLTIAKHQYPGQRNSLDALVRRLNVGNQDRTFHGALLDSEILAEVYLAMTGGQVSLAIDEEGGSDGDIHHSEFLALANMLIADTSDLTPHEEWLDKISAKFPEVKNVWSMNESPVDQDQQADLF